VDLLSTPVKTCSYDCIYCQLGTTTQRLLERKEFVSVSRLALELEQVKERDLLADHVTFSGLGEPTLSSNLGRAIETARAALKLPVAVLTNSSLMTEEDVRRDLSLADMVVAKLDAPNDEVFQTVNRPAVGYGLNDIVEGLKRFRLQYKGKLALQMMFVRQNKDFAAQMARLASQISPDEVQINTPLRACAVKPLGPKEIAEIRGKFDGFRAVVTVYEKPRPRVEPLDPHETLRRRPE
jgi:wyosine [tRNA(Phe)-imidazoG37] synthetase (radical SAM superfamily)